MCFHSGLCRAGDFPSYDDDDENDAMALTAPYILSLTLYYCMDH